MEMCGNFISSYRKVPFAKLLAAGVMGAVITLLGRELIIALITYISNIGCA